jgi:hypothetical protein
MIALKDALLGFVERFAGSLRFPHLFWLTAILFLLDVLIPDLIPFADEILLGLATLLLGSWKTKRDSGREPQEPADASERGRVIDVKPDG